MAGLERRVGLLDARRLDLDVPALGAPAGTSDVGVRGVATLDLVERAERLCDRRIVPVTLGWMARVDADAPVIAEGGLAARLAARDDEAWESVYVRVYPRLLAYAARRLGADRGRDAVAETMRRAVGAIDRYHEGVGSIDGWLFGICRHVVLDELRAMGRQVRVALLADPVSPDPGPLEVAVRRSEFATVRSAFAQLRDADRELLELRVVARLSAEEVGSMLHKRPGAVRMAQARALARLRTLIDDEERDR